MKKIGIWGQFGDGEVIADGQAVRTTIITEELKKRYGSNNIEIVNTANWKKHPLSFLFKTIKLYFDCTKIVIFPADNGFKIVTFVYSVLGLIKKKELFDVVIGGYLPGLIDKHKRYAKRLKKYRALFVQTPNLKSDLNIRGLNNVYILSNLKRLNTRRLEEISLLQDRRLKVCTLSRITESKGIDDAVEAVRLTNEKLGGIFIRLDIFGIVANDYKNHFENLLLDNSSFVNYGGVLQYDKTSDTLKNYFAMLFPTFYYGEGFPGNVVDALNAGIPIIATDWNYNKEVIIDKRNGLLVPIHDPLAISDALMTFYNNRQLACEISKNNVIDASQYSPDRVLEVFYSFFDE